MDNNKNFEQSLQNLDFITKEIEKKSTTLDKSLELYKQGIEEAIFCSQFLTDFENQVKVLQKQFDDSFTLTSFEGDFEEQSYDF